MINRIPGQSPVDSRQRDHSSPLHPFVRNHGTVAMATACGQVNRSEEKMKVDSLSFTNATERRVPDLDWLPAHLLVERNWLADLVPWTQALAIMMGRETTDAPDAVGQPLFATTHWSVVLAAAENNAPQSATALERLCRTYWYPLYAYVRREGYSPADAQDLTQEFFARLLARHSLAQVAPEKGRFRSFLLAAMRHFLSDQRDRASAVKRGGGAEVLSLDAQEAEERYRLEPVDHLDAEKIYERRWAMTLVEKALERLRDESVAAGKGGLFERLRRFVAGESEATWGEAAAELALSEGAMKAAVHRLRERYRVLLRDEIAHTVADPAEIEEEVRYLIRVISEGGRA
jgi:RNA polymerase sigma-70 factor (ECF subfamily)